MYRDTAWSASPSDKHLKSVVNVRMPKAGAVQKASGFLQVKSLSLRASWAVDCASEPE
jgi:hypothetical protein